MTSASNFIQAMNEAAVPVKEQVIGLVWFLTSGDKAEFTTVGSVCMALEAAGHAKQNRSRMRGQLDADRRVVKRGEGFAISARSKPEIGKKFELFTSQRSVRASDSVLPRELFEGTRNYIVRVVAQINGSYDHAMHDCCAVMCRRLAETLIIEVYEAVGRTHQVKDANNNFLMLSGLLDVLKKDGTINLGRNSKRGLEELKELGDRAAHNRRFNARQSDIDAVKVGLRTAAEELLHLAGLAK